MQKIILSDCLAALREMADNSVDSIVTDPPYGLTNNSGGPAGRGADNPAARSKAGAVRTGFMGMAWDGDVPPVEVWVECLRVLKPGGHLLAFAGTRTQHRMATRIEDAGFELRDMLAWVYGSGFPKSHNGDWGGTGLKPALEPITMARKPLIGTVEANWREHGTGALNIDACRVGWPGGVPPEIGTPGWGGPAKKLTAVPGQFGETVERSEPNALGRWPANLIHDGSPEVLAAFPQAQGQQGRARTDGAAQGNNTFGALRHVTKQPEPRVEDDKSAARFFYCAKASKKERGDGNTHPTVKPVELMRYLCRLVTPAGGLVLDPYAGSGSTGVAAIAEGFRFVGIEREPAYAAIAQQRVAGPADLIPMCN